ncbi:hypothetical protein L249_6293 [Ophiocordyceps polyrhachis-furcata BCC 54312]|uniref:Uncharacterized protein n=1 Tax=Ophiocordyceps polyrhachis-furcata BCC 54312 TaxID=1330021 RepID=A0A367L1M5_9HYPO|nr:hypothetical protein L249_6293 [Ophiocordyceps polyrhachis-furcata BCC 54312]
MSDRPPRHPDPPSAAAAASAAPPRTRGTVAAAAAARANLFRSQLTRRPTVSSTTSVETLRLDVDVLSDTSEIVVRNLQGEIDLGDPPTLPVAEQHAETQTVLETDRNKQRVADAVKNHAVNNTSFPDQPEELLEAVRADLRAKVNALADDNWMFEAEEPTRG